MILSPQTNTKHAKLALALLAGGQGKRIGTQNKGLVLWQGRPMICYVLDWILAETKALETSIEVVLVTNDRLDDYQTLINDYDFSIQLVSDRYPGFLGPLAGLDAVLSNTNADWIQCLPCDCPTPPPGLVARLIKYHNEAPIIIPKDTERDQPLFAQINRNLWPQIIHALEHDQLAVYRWMKTHPSLTVDVSDLIPKFTNLNSLSLLNEES